MLQHNSVTIHVACCIIACILFAFAGFYWPEPLTPHRGKLVALGLFFWCLSTFFN